MNVTFSRIWAAALYFGAAAGVLSNASDRIDAGSPDIMIWVLIVVGASFYLLAGWHLCTWSYRAANLVYDYVWDKIR